MIAITYQQLMKSNIMLQIRVLPSVAPDNDDSDDKEDNDDDDGDDDDDDGCVFVFIDDLFVCLFCFKIWQLLAINLNVSPVNQSVRVDKSA